MDIWRFITGEIQAKLTSAQPEEDLQKLTCLGVTLWELDKLDDLSYTFRLSRRDWPAALGYCRKKGSNLSIVRKIGLFWKGKAMLSRPVLVLGLGLLLGLTFFLPSRVLFVEVEGNQQVPSRQILEAAQECGLGFWTPRRQLRSEKIKNGLLSAIPQLQWAGVNTKGCVATISIREGSREAPEPSPLAGAVVASRDGFLISTTVTKGSSLCTPGQTVKAGQTLISGYTDCGICIRFDGAEGEILAQTNRSLAVVTPTDWLEPGESQGVKRKISLTLGKKRINFWKDSGILEGSCGRMVAEYELTLPGGFSLPVSVWVETYPQRTMTVLSLPEGAADLPTFGETYLTSQMRSGTILSRRERIWEEEGTLHMAGEYVCTEDIGRSSTEQVEDIHGKTN